MENKNLKIGKQVIDFCDHIKSFIDSELSKEINTDVIYFYTFLERCLNNGDIKFMQSKRYELLVEKQIKADTQKKINQLKENEARVSKKLDNLLSGKEVISSVPDSNNDVDIVKK